MQDCLYLCTDSGDKTTPEVKKNKIRRRGKGLVRSYSRVRLGEIAVNADVCVGECVLLRWN